MRSFTLFCVFLAGVSSVAAQSNQSCPVVAIESVDKVDQNAPLVFNARLNNSAANEGVKYNWRVSVGTITAGENTSTITVDTAGLAGQIVTATVEVVGIASCSVKSKEVGVVGPLIICDMAFDEYGDIHFEDEKARLDNFAFQLANTPSARGAILVFAGKKTYPGEASDLLRRAKNYMVKVRDIPAERIITVDSGFRNDLTTYLYVVPAGASLPSLDSLPIQEVKFTKRRPTTKKRVQSRKPWFPTEEHS